MQTTEIDNGQDIIDSRDVIARIAELEANEDRDDDEIEELASLVALASEGESSPDWTYGEALIRDSYFEDYARELAEDIGAVQRDASWPNSYIDWKAAAEALQMDYFTVDFAGVEYWIRG